MTDQARGAGHTKGPWAVNPFAAQVDAFDAEDASPLPICQLLWPTDKRTERETYANARLIAAAPDLLESLESMTQIVKGDMGVDPLPTSDNPMESALAKALAAIAKAKGEA